MAWCLLLFQRAQVWFLAPVLGGWLTNPAPKGSDAAGLFSHYTHVHRHTYTLKINLRR